MYYEGVRRYKLEGLVFLDPVRLHISNQLSLSVRGMHCPAAFFVSVTGSESLAQSGLRESGGDLHSIPQVMVYAN